MMQYYCRPIDSQIFRSIKQRRCKQKRNGLFVLQRPLYLRVVKSVSLDEAVELVSHVQAPAGRWPQLQRAPDVEFSVAALVQSHCRAERLPQEQVAFWAGRAG